MQHDAFSLRRWRATQALLAPEVRSMAMLGFVNAGHLLVMHAKCLEHADTDNPLAAQLHLRVAMDCLLCALEEDILDPDAPGLALGLDAHMGILPPGVRGLLERLRDFASKSTDMAGTADGRPLSARDLAVQTVLQGQYSLLLDLAKAVQAEQGLEPAARRLKADALFHSGDLERAEALYRSLDKEGLPLAGQRHAQTLLCLGRRDEAAAMLGRIVHAAPWRTNMVLKLHDLLRGLDEYAAQGPTDMQRTSVLLYSWNHAPDLDRTLQSLAASTAPALAAMDVFVLNNGSTDDTAAVLERWKDSGAFPNFEVVTLPINIGAPAARNWLLHMNAVQHNGCIAFLDDDIVLAPGWLEALFRAREAAPEAGAWGAKVVEMDRPHVIQQADLNLFWPPVNNEFVGFSDLQAGVPDTGQFDYLRPAASVTGCCHLFERKTFEAVGDFDIRFSPSQYDDFDHSMRMIRAGLRSVYTGHVAVGHVRAAGHGASISRAALYNVFGNVKKLEGKHDPEAVQECIRTMDAVLLDDYQAKLAVIREALRDD